MRVEVENTGEIGRKMTVSVPAAELETAIRKRVGELSKTVRLSGFRPGKVPHKIIEKRFGEEIKGEILTGIIERSYREALDQEGLTPATEPAIEPTSLDRGSDVEYVASFDVFPEIGQGNLRGVRIDKPVCEVSDDDIDRTLERMRSQRVEFEAEDAGADTGDQVRIGFVGKIDDEAFEGGSVEDYRLVLGSGTVLPELEAGIIGMRAEDEKSIEVAFPAEYPQAELAGKAAVFEVKMIEVSKPKLPELDEAFVKTFGIEDGDMDKLRNEIKGSLERERDERANARVKEQVFQALRERNTFELPEKLVENEIESMIESFRQMMLSRDVEAPAEISDEDREAFREEARNRVSIGLIMRGILKKDELTADPGRIRAKVESIAEGYAEPEQVMHHYYSNNENLAQIEAAILEDQLIEHLLRDADVVDDISSFAEFMYPTEDSA